ncbi:MAG: methionine--tRNA ligase [Candidatus Cloacimonas sp. 4484_209]|nr:MAG: methionine--tRNA ligase [Candidatus Cloacimonas sp. 4484_209]
MPERIIITSALPYANGPIHLGHLAGCYLPADIYYRYQKLKKRDVIYVCGTDENGVPITIEAEKNKQSPRTLVDYYYKEIKESFEKFGIIYDNFSRTSTPLHYKNAQEFFRKIYDKNYIITRKTKQYYCPHCKRFLADRYIEGICPYCGSEEARGDQCESCGRWLDPEDLISPRCKICGETPVLKETIHWYFRLDLLQTKLEEWIEEKNNWRNNVKRFCRGWFKEGLKPRAITRDLSWGVPVPLEETKGKVLYVWFDAPIGYITSTMEWASKTGDMDKWKDYWLDKDTKLIHFIGKDNIVFHAIVWPAMLMAHGDFVLPSEIPANEFLNIKGGKLSTSRRRAIWLSEVLKNFDPDLLRYALAVNLPENKDTEFDWNDFQNKVNNELANILGNFVNRTLSFVKNNYSSKVPHIVSPTNDDKKMLAYLEETKKKMEDRIERFELKKGIKILMELAKEANRYFDRTKPWEVFKKDRERCGEIINTCVQVVDGIATLSQPYLPFTSEKILKMLNKEVTEWDEIGTMKVKSGKGINEVKILFNKVEDEAIKIEQQKIGLKEEKLEGVISINDFAKLDLRVATIENAERVENTKKLIKIQIDVGGEKRQIVASIAEYYTPEELIGKNIVVVANLAPAKIRGVESNGMLLAATKENKCVLVTIDRPIDSGSKVS